MLKQLFRNPKSLLLLYFNGSKNSILFSPELKIPVTPSITFPILIHMSIFVLGFSTPMLRDGSGYGYQSECSLHLSGESLWEV